MQSTTVMEMAKTRNPIITVLGHVDHGKTQLLDYVRGSTIVEREYGRITQHIGATEVPLEAIKRISGKLIDKFGFKVSLPGLLFIDTPGHEAFTNLRKRGGSIADLAVLVVDVNQGMQPQSYEAIDILSSYKVPFIVALTKIDLMRGWNSQEKSSIANLKNQTPAMLELLDKKIYELVGLLHKKGFQSERFDRIEDFTKQIPIVPVSSKTGEGIPELLMFLSGLSQKYLEKKLQIEVKGPGKGTILEVKEERGLGKTIDVIIYDGEIKVNDRIAVGGLEVRETKVRALLKPRPLEEIRDPKERFLSVREAHAACGVKIAAPGLDKALSGAPVKVIATGKEAEEIRKELGSITFEREELGPILKTDAIGSLEALEKLLDNEGIKIKKAGIGDVSKKDLSEAEAIKEKDKLKGVVLAFGVNASKEVREEAEKREIKVFSGKVVYKLLEDYTAWIKAEKEAEKKATLERMVYPYKIRILEGMVFRHSKPAVVGVRVLAGIVKPGTKVMKHGKTIGEIKAIQDKGKNIAQAEKDSEVALSIDGPTIGRQLFEKDTLYSMVPETHYAKLKNFLNEEDKELLEEIKQKKKEAEKEVDEE